MGRFFISVLLFAFGFIVMKYAYTIVQWFGQISWAEQTFGGAGTHTLYKLFGLGLIIVSLLYLFGILERIFA